MAVQLRLGRTNSADIAVISSSSSVGSLVASNLQDEDIARLWRGNSGSEWILATFENPVLVGAVLLVNTNLRSGDTVRVRVSTSSPTAGDVHDSGVIPSGVGPIYGKMVYFIEPAAFGSYVRIDLAQLDNCEAGRLYCGDVWTPSHNRSHGWEDLARDPSRRTYSLGQNIYTDVQRTQRGFRFSIKGLSEEEARSEVRELNRIFGTKKDMLVCLDSTSTDLGRDSVWGLMEETARSRQVAHNWWEVEFEVWERL